MAYLHHHLFLGALLVFAASLDVSQGFAGELFGSADGEASRIVKYICESGENTYIGLNLCNLLRTFDEFGQDTRYGGDGAGGHTDTDRSGKDKGLGSVTSDVTDLASDAVKRITSKGGIKGASASRRALFGDFKGGAKKGAPKDKGVLEESMRYVEEFLLSDPIVGLMASQVSREGNAKAKAKDSNNPYANGGSARKLAGDFKGGAKKGAPKDKGVLEESLRYVEEFLLSDPIVGLMASQVSREGNAKAKAKNSNNPYSNGGSARKLAGDFKGGAKKGAPKDKGVLEESMRYVEEFLLSDPIVGLMASQVSREGNAKAKAKDSNNPYANGGSARKLAGDFKEGANKGAPKDQGMFEASMRYVEEFLLSDPIVGLMASQVSREGNARGKAKDGKSPYGGALKGGKRKTRMLLRGVKK